MPTDDVIECVICYGLIGRHHAREHAQWHQIVADPKANRDYLDRLLEEKARQEEEKEDCNTELEQERSSNALPMLAIGNDETPAWFAERMCPECGEGPLDLQWSEPPILGFISHCGGSWLRSIKGHKGSEQPA